MPPICAERGRRLAMSGPQLLQLILQLHGVLGICASADTLRPIGKHRVAREFAHASGGGRRTIHSSAKEMIYVYDMPAKYTEDILALPAEWHPEQYDYDQVLHKHLLSSPLRTVNPQQAQLFFIPVYLGRHFNWFWQQWSTPGDPWEILKDCEPRFRAPSAECWYEKWAWAKGNTSELVREALAHVRGAHPHWDRRGGADHFMVFSFDHARCDMAAGLSAGELGQMFSVQSYGDLTSTNNPEVPPLIQRWREDNYSWEGPRSWACFRPDADILVPMFYASAPEDIVSPFEGARNVSMLMRFAYQKGDGKNLVEHYGHRLRYELIEYWRADPLEGSDQGLRSSATVACDCAAQETEADMARSVFCVCAPGATQDTTRVFKAILKGCIPVTFFRANELPFARFLGIPYEDFVLNIQPDDYRQLNSRVASVLGSPLRLRRMQEALQAHQRHFTWAGGRDGGGVIANIDRELGIRVAMLNNDVHRSVLARRRRILAPHV